MKIKIPEDKQGFVPVEDVANFFHVSISTVRVWVRQKVLPPETYIKVGGVQRFDLAGVVQALTGAGVDVTTAVDPFGTGKNLEKEEVADKEETFDEDLEEGTYIPTAGDTDGVDLDEFPDFDDEDDEEGY